MKQYHLYQVDAFTKTKCTGNPAGVITNADGLTPQQMQQIARELNHSETAFLLSPQDDSHQVWVRYFTPTREVPICGHATIAAHYAWALEQGADSCRRYQKTGAGVLPVEIVKTGDDYRVVMTQGEISIGEPLAEDLTAQLADALGLDRSQLREDCPIVVASTGHSKVMIGIRQLETLHGLTPDMSRLAALSERIGSNGYYVFTLHPGEKQLVHGRMFAPAIGIAEDPVTGNANGPLGAYLAHFGLVDTTGPVFSFEAVQGEAMGRPGSMKVDVSIQNHKPVSVQITGEAVVVFSTLLEL